jgi:hypothetical protein
MFNTWADVLNRAGLGMEVMHERNAHNFPLDLAAAESTLLLLLLHLLLVDKNSIVFKTSFGGSFFMVEKTDYY